MYKITLFDYNCPACWSGTFSCYCDDIDRFEEEWTRLEKDEERIERFRRSKAGEIVTDYYSDDPELNIVQEDPEAKVFYEKKIEMRQRKVKVYNSYNRESEIFADRYQFHIKYVKFQGKYLRLVRYKLYGVCQKDYFGFGNYRRNTCFGNPVLIEHYDNKKKRLSDNTEDFQNDTVESIIYYESGNFDTLEELQAAYETDRENFLSDEELNLLLADIPGEAG